MNVPERKDSLLLPEGTTLTRACGILEDVQNTKLITRENSLKQARLEPGENPLVYLDFMDWTIARRDLGRYLFVLVMFLRRNGFKVAVGGGFSTICKLQTKFGRLLLKHHFIQIPESRYDRINADIYISDHDQIPENVIFETQIRVVTGARLTTTRDYYDLLFPYMLHPTFYYWGYDLTLNEWRREKRSVKILFSGNMGSRYDNSQIWERFQKHSRMQVFSTLFDGLEEKEFRLIATENEFQTILERYDGSFFCIDNSRGFRVPKRQWLKFLGRTDFQVCAPGVDMPLCHNSVEGMSVGCIPILEYPEFFDPPLRDGIDCIVFSSKKGLLSAVRRCLNMDEEEVRRLRHQVLHYYQTHLTTESFGRKLLGLQKPRATLGMNFIH